MKKRIITLLLTMVCMLSYSQSTMEELLRNIEQNNSTLRALRESIIAEKLENRTDIFLPNPEFGFNYLWGTPSSNGNRYDISVTQSFDAPTISGLKSKVANEQNAMLEWDYKAERMNLLLEAKEYYLDVVYYNALLEELNLRLVHAQAISKSQKERLESGDANILEYNNVKINLASAHGEILRVETERAVVLSELTRLNGGKNVTISESNFPTLSLPLNFEQWYAQAEQQSPVLAYVRQELEWAKKEVSLNKATWFPTLSAGYMNETVVGETYQGITLSLSIPAWENSNKIKQAKAQQVATEAKADDMKLQFYGQLHTIYQRTIGLQRSAEIYREAFKDANNSELLKKALDAGQISMVQYMLEMSLYYSTITQALEAERDYQKAYAKLVSFEL